MTDEDRNAWERMQQLVEFRFDRLEKLTEQLQDDTHRISEQVIVLKVKAALWGAFAAMIVSAVTATVVAKVLH